MKQVKAKDYHWLLKPGATGFCFLNSKKIPVVLRKAFGCTVTIDGENVRETWHTGLHEGSLWSLFSWNI